LFSGKFGGGSIPVALVMLVLSVNISAIKAVDALSTPPLIIVYASRGLDVLMAGVPAVSGLDLTLAPVKL
jgi:hypothetical protein